MRGGGKYTVIPHVAVANVSCRLVPGQDPDAVIEAIVAHVAAQAPGACASTVRPGRGPGAGLHDRRRITRRSGRPPPRSSTVYPDQQVLLAVHRRARCRPPTLFERVLGVKTLFFSFSTADEKLHAPNEFLRIRRLREGMRAWEQLWRLLADGPNRLAAAGGRPRG